MRMCISIIMLLPTSGMLRSRHRSQPPRLFAGRAAPGLAELPDLRGQKLRLHPQELRLLAPRERHVGVWLRGGERDWLIRRGTKGVPRKGVRTSVNMRV